MMKLYLVGSKLLIGGIMLLSMLSVGVVIRFLWVVILFIILRMVIIIVFKLIMVKVKMIVFCFYGYGNLILVVFGLILFIK